MTSALKRDRTSSPVGHQHHSPEPGKRKNASSARPSRPPTNAPTNAATSFDCAAARSRRRRRRAVVSRPSPRSKLTREPGNGGGLQIC